MNHALLSHETESAEASRKSSGLRINPPGDSFEHEADRVAETVSGGGYVPARHSGFGATGGRIQRQSASQFPFWQGGQQAGTNPNVLGDALSALIERLLKVNDVQALIQRVGDTPLGKNPGTAAAVIVPFGVGTLAGLGADHLPLPLQVPPIPVGNTGLKLKVTLNGPVSSPTSFTVSIVYGEKSDKKDPDARQQRAAETEATRRRLQVESFQPRTQLDRVKTEEQKKQERAIEKVTQGPPLRAPGMLSGALFHSEPAFDVSQMGKNYPRVLTEPPTRDKPTISQPSHDAAKAEEKREELHVQRKAAGELEAGDSSADVDTVLHSGGYPLDRETRHYMESRIGFDFGRVRIHTDQRAASSAKSMGALAYTVGNDVVFAAGHYAPGTTQGRRLLAHELTHVVQQNPVQKPAHATAAVGAAPRRIQRWPDFLAGIKEKALAKLRTLPGYDLFAVILGKDPISGQPVERNATNLTHGILELVPGGEDAYKRMQESGAIERAYNWLMGEVDKLGFSEDYFFGLLEQAKDAISINLDETWGRIKEIFGEPYRKLKAFASSVLHKVLEFVLEAALEAIGGKEIAEQIMDFFRKAGNAIRTIVNDPAAFLGHLLEAVKQGFGQFKNNILEHLKNGLVQWLFGEIAATGLTLPKKFDFPAGVIGLVLQVLGITYGRFKKKLENILGEPAVQFLEGSFELLKTIYQHGIGAAWKVILDKAEGLFDTVMASIKDWVVTKIVTLAVTHLASLFNPVGGVIESIRVIYETIKFFIDKAKQVGALLSAIVDSIAEIAGGNIEKAANWIEQSLARAIPLVLRFLAGLIGLGNIGDKLREIIKNIQAKVDGAMDKVLEYIAAKGRELWSKGKDTFNYVAEWWKSKRKVKVGEEDHEVSIEGDEDHPEVMVASQAPTTLKIFLDSLDAPKEQKRELVNLARRIKLRRTEVKDKDKQGNDGEKNFQLLLDKIAALKLTGGGRPPESKFNKPQSVNVFRGGVDADIFLSLNHPVGTTPDKTSEPAIWKDLGPALRNKKSYVRGHLLSQRLGGQGRWENMMPITNSANQTMLNHGEKQIINAIGTGRALIHYVVDAKYDESITKPASPQQAEQRLEKLSWKWNPAVCDNGNWSDTKEKPKDQKGNAIPDVEGADYVDPKQ